MTPGLLFMWALAALGITIIIAVIVMIIAALVLQIKKEFKKQ